MKRQLLLFLIFSTLETLNAQTQREIYNASIKAYEGKDYKTFLKLTRTLDSLRPLHPTYTYNLASANALNDNPEEALIALKKLVLMNNTTAFESDEDFKSMQQDQGFKNIIELKKTQTNVIATSKPVTTLSEKELHPEGFAYLPKSKTWLASSIRKRKIVSFDQETGKCTDWLKDKSMFSVMALKADLNNQYLWVATAAMPEMEGYDKAFEGKSEVLKVDIKTKQILKRFPVDGNHVFGDLIVDKKGSVYISDSGKPMIYKIENDKIAEFASFENDGFNLQGLAFNDTQDRLFVADYLKGIAVIAIKSKSVKWLAFPDDASAKGIDGLVFYHNSLIAVQNGVNPIRITQFQLNVEQNEISSFKILDNNRPEFNEPALATIVGEKLYFFANSPWSAYDGKGNLDATKVANPALFSCKLD